MQLPGPVDGGADTVAVGEVQGDGIGDAAGGADLRDDAVEGVGAARGEHDGGALAGEEPGRRGADAAAGAGDEDDLAGEQADGVSAVGVGHAAKAGRRRGCETGTTGTTIHARGRGRLGA